MPHFPETAVYGVLVCAPAPQSCVFPQSFAVCWALWMIIVVLLLQFFTPRVPAGRVRDYAKCVIWCLCSYLWCSYWMCSSKSVFPYCSPSSYWCWNSATYFGVCFFPDSFPFVLKIKCKTVESMFCGNRRNLSETPKKTAVWCIIIILVFFLIRLLELYLISGPGLRVEWCVTGLSQLSVCLQQFA